MYSDTLAAYGQVMRGISLFAQVLAVLLTMSGVVCIVSSHIAVMAVAVQEKDTSRTLSYACW